MTHQSTEKRPCSKCGEMTVLKGQKIPQTVESLQKIMERDAVFIMEQAKEIAALKVKVNQLQQKLKSRAAQPQGEI